MKTFKSLLPLLAAFFLISCNLDNKVELFNGENLDNWFIFVSDSSIDPSAYFTVEEGVIRTDGIPNGYIRTKDVYSNYKLHVEWRWPEEPTNSGVLLHVQGEDKCWPHCVECQLASGKAGDIILMGPGAGITVKDSAWIISPTESWYKRIPKFEGSSEKPAGEWNSYDITSQDGKLEVIVNGILQNRGKLMTLREGHILLQGEGSPVEFRNIWLEPLE